MTITAITGDIGSGKSWKQFHYALYCCQRYKKKLVTNFGVNIPAIKKYAASKDYWWVVWLCDNGQITIYDLNSPEDLEKVLSIPSSIVCLDEAGIFLNTRQFSRTPQGLLTDLAQSRKTGTDLIYAAQFDGQVDKQFRLLTQYFIHAEGTTIWSKKLRNQRLVWKKYTTFTAAKYWEWVNNPKKRNSGLRTWFASISVSAGPFTLKDAMIFDCFQSFGRLDKQSSNVVMARQKYKASEHIKIANSSAIASHQLADDSYQAMRRVHSSGYPDFLLPFLFPDVYRRYRRYVPIGYRPNCPSVK